MVLKAYQKQHINYSLVVCVRCLILHLKRTIYGCFEHLGYKLTSSREVMCKFRLP